MRWMSVIAAVFIAMPAQAEEVEVDAAVYLETGSRGSTELQPSSGFARGDQIVTIMNWQAPRNGAYRLTSALPRHLRVQSASNAAIEVSTDGGRTWKHVDDPESIPFGATHLRWNLRGSAGSMSYRAVVR